MTLATVHHCETMTEVRAYIDALDARIVPLLAERSGYVAQAARIKQHADQVHDQARIDFIVDRVTAMARAEGAPEAVVEATYRAMIDASITFERTRFQQLRQEA
jgi:isochorismate pyruvate lyase